VVYLYVLPLGGEDWLKLGISLDPLARARQFHPRFFEVFDLERGWLVQLPSRREAAAAELRLRRALSPHRSPMPVHLRASAGGKTEWLRGACSPLREEGERLAALGHPLHLPATPWFAASLAARRDDVNEWSHHCLRAFGVDDDLPDPMPAGLQSLLADGLDAYLALNVDLDAVLPAVLLPWYRRRLGLVPR
jgi:hypothetical protein